jgi:hypothetical protein
MERSVLAVEVVVPTKQLESDIVPASQFAGDTYDLSSGFVAPRVTGTVWDDVVETGARYPGTEVPRSFRLGLDDGRLRDGEGALSFRDSISKPMAPGHPVMHPGREYVALDTSMLPNGSVVSDGVPGSAVTLPGHVSVFVDDVDILRAAIIEKGKFPK